MENNNLILNRLFTQYMFDDLVENSVNDVYCTIVKRYLKDENEEKNGEIISKIYKYMSKNYRNEYFYQNTILNKLLLGRHSINTTTALTQIPVGKSKADFIMINGKAVVYEIKTELDSFERLENQISDYYKAFNNVCVVTCEQNFKKINDLLNETPVGICILSNKNTLQFRKEPEENNKKLSHIELFKVLHKNEFKNIITEYHGKLPDATPAFYYDECLVKFSEISMEILYPMFLKQLKRRNQIKYEFYKNVPYELKSLMYFYKASKKDYINLEKFLNDKYRG